MPGRIVVGGLGPGGDDHLTDEVRRRIRSAHAAGTPVRLRTSVHPSAAVAAHPDTGVIDSYDHHYETADRFDDVYAAITEDLLALAADAGEVLYLVPGSPLVLERVVARLRTTDDVDVELLPALSFLDLCWARLGIDPIEDAVRLVDGHTFATSAAGETGALLVAHCHANWVLSDIKLSVEDGPDEPVALLRALGTAEEQVVWCDWADLDRTIEADHLTTLYIPNLGASVAGELQRSVELMDRLRVECPWDAKQTHQSLRRYLIEEAYEVLDAIDGLDVDAGTGYEDLEEELGDVWFQLLFHAKLAAEAGQFTIADVARTLHDKLVGRHPHVFGEVEVDSADDVLANWELIKREEKQRASVMDGIPSSLPALAFAEKVLKKADRVGSPIESDRLAPVEADDDEAALGRRLLAIVEEARRAGLDPEQALRTIAGRAAERHRDREVTGAVEADWLP